jgi:hypothetical protein
MHQKDNNTFKDDLLPIGNKLKALTIKLMYPASATG